MLAGLILILLGIVFFLKNIGVIGAQVWSVFWPLALVIIGAYLIFKVYRINKTKEYIKRSLGRFFRIRE